MSFVEIIVDDSTIVLPDSIFQAKSNLQNGGFPVLTAAVRGEWYISTLRDEEF